MGRLAKYRKKKNTNIHPVEDRELDKEKEKNHISCSMRRFHRQNEFFKMQEKKARLKKQQKYKNRKNNNNNNNNKNKKQKNDNSDNDESNNENKKEKYPKLKNLDYSGAPTIREGESMRNFNRRLNEYTREKIKEQNHEAYMERIHRKNKMKKEKRRKKIEKYEDELLKEAKFLNFKPQKEFKFTEDVEFGDIVQQPPLLLSRPKTKSKKLISSSSSFGSDISTTDTLIENNNNNNNNENISDSVLSLVNAIRQSDTKVIQQVIEFYNNKLNN
eukprot:TRINITY_DN458_c0_g4_i1.p1 TRINITY_DN458_c0_g4~~TRINITY_DN458_c0_g4_i1.p1  ORF type:complete len:273 (-),score=97.02 TRINITY_DN458_c0_g4_i1:55-873(-)